MKNYTLTSLFICFTFFFLNGQSFEEVSSANGINTSYGVGHFGGGVSFCDFTGDGWDDLTFASQEGDSLYFFVNDNGAFHQIPSLVAHTGEAKQILWVDFDNDSDKDLFVSTNFGFNRLYRNDGDLVMTDITVTSGIINEGFSPSYGAIFGDYNKDGWLDLYVCNREVTGFTNYLYKNNGDGTFLDVSEAANADNFYIPSFCAAFFDFNQDGNQDIYIAEDKSFVSTLLKNKGNNTFQDISAQSGAGITIDAMNVGIGDYDNDGDQDIYVTNGYAGNKLLRNNGDETFTEVAEVAGVGFYTTAWGGNFLDCDNDGDLDLYVCSSNEEDSNALYLNLGDGTFEKDSLDNDGGLNYSNVFGDFNKDGKLDLAVNGVEETNFRLWENQHPSVGNWLQIELTGTISNKDGIGSWIEIYANGQKQIRYTHCGLGYLGQNFHAVHVGLGDATVVDSVKIKWLSGVEDFLTDIDINQRIFVEEGSFTSTTSIDKTAGIFMKISPNPVTSNNLFVDIFSKKGHSSNLKIVSLEGKVVFEKKLSILSGSNTVNIEIPDFPKGIYQVVLKNEEGQISETLSIQ